MLREAYIAEVGKLVDPLDCIFVNRGNDSDLSPGDDLFKEFTYYKQMYPSFPKLSADSHNNIILRIDFERRFRKQITNNKRALFKLKKISEASRKQDIYLVCYEGLTKLCHRRILLRMCAELFGADVEVRGIEERSLK